MKRLDGKHMSWSVLFCFLIPLFIPSAFLSEGMGRYTYGFPFKFITIYQREANSVWFFDNLFNGNAGMAINPVSIVLNVFLIYFIIRFVVNMRKKKKT